MDEYAVDDDLDALIHAADLDALIRMIDDRCSARDWPGLLRVRNRSRHAVNTGRQLWPAATLAEFRLALLAPAEVAAVVLDESDGMSGRFTVGPLTEVVAQHHTWLELAPLLGAGPRAAFVAHERAIRGETIVGEVPPALEIPTELQDWEPAYCVATYSTSDAQFPAPDLPTNWVEVTPTADAEVLDDDVAYAVRQLVEPWVAGSNGQAEVVCVEGTASDALGALGLRRARLSTLDARTALAWIAWAGSSGGAFGRRRGAAAGRFGAWWVLGALGDYTAGSAAWPPDVDELGRFANELRWYRWDAYEPMLGWNLQIAIEDVDEGVAWAINARDGS